MILAGTNYDNFVEALEKMRVPYVLLGNNFITQNNRERLDQVRFDDFSGVKEATEYRGMPTVRYSPLDLLLAYDKAHPQTEGQRPIMAPKPAAPEKKAT